MKRHRRLVPILASIPLLWLGACGDDGGGEVDAPPVTPDAPGPVVDAPPPTPDAPLPDAPPPPDTAHLLITEVTLTDASSEFLEIYNPGTQTVSLANYYIADDAEYWRLPAVFSGIDPATQPYPDINLDFDFIARFPATASIAPGEAKTIAMSYNVFDTQYGMPPDFALTNAPNADTAMIDPGEASGVQLKGNTPQLTNAGEAIVLFYWNSETDLVADVDLLNAGGQPSPANQLESKSGQSLDGPDPDNTPTDFAPETATSSIALIDAPAGSNESHKRILLEDGNETQDGTGNGVFGDDEFSEDVTMTWDSSANFTPPTPGEVPASLTR